mgnify:FL=1|jgi:hypothetical protein
MQDTLITDIQKWFKSQCNGDWEHSFGLNISTLDNPGWYVKIDLIETNLENINYQKKVDNGDNDWYIVKVENSVFEAFGDTSKLETILQLFINEIVNYKN